MLSGSYNPQSNYAAERVCKSLREVLEKRGGKKTSQLEISEICFKVNSISQPAGRGSASERFLKRRPKTLLPASMEDHINHVEMGKKRYEHQLSLSKKKGCTSVDQFGPGDRMVIQCNNSGKWIEEGVIEQKRTADDSSTQSYEVRMENGNLKIRNKRFIKQCAVHEEPDNRGQLVLTADSPESNASRPQKHFFFYIFLFKH